MRAPTLAHRGFAISLSVLLTACAGEDGAAGPKGDPGAPGQQGPQGDPGSPDTAAEVLAKVVTVDGDGSGLDADTLDGLHSTDFSTATTRTAQVSQGGALADSGQTSVGGMILLPQDLVADTSLRIRMVYARGTANPCNVVLLGTVTVIELGTGTGPTLSVGPTTVSVPDISYYEQQLDTPINPGVVGPGKWARVNIRRFNADPEDTCVGSIYVEGVALDYEAM